MKQGAFALAVAAALAFLPSARAEIVNVDFNGRGGGDAPAPTYVGSGAAGGGTVFNGVTADSSGGNVNLTVTASGLLSDTNTATTVGLTISPVAGDYHAPGATPNNDLFRDYVYVTGGNHPFTISGLGSAPTADLYFYYRQDFNMGMTITIGTETADTFTPVGIFTAANTKYFANVPVVAGAISGTWSPGSTQVLNGLTVKAAPQQSLITTTTVTSSVNPSTVGVSVTFTATIHPISGVPPFPPGTVQFKVDGSNLGDPVEVTAGTSPDGTAQISTDALTVAGSPHVVTAVYTSTDNSDSSTGTLTDGQTVNPAAASVLVFTTSPNIAFAGSPFGTQPVIRTRDAFGNNSTVGLAASEIVTIAIMTGTGTLGGTSTYDIGTAAGNGTITGDGLAIDTAGSFTLGASSLNLTEGESASFTVQAAGANRLLNPSFAGNTANWTLAGGGILYESQYIPGSHDAIGRSIRMMDPGGTLTQTVTLPAGNYALSGWFTGGTLTFQLRDSGNTPVTPSGSASPAPSGAPQSPAPGDWVNWTRQYTGLAAGTYTVYVYCNTGWVHADDFSLTQISGLSTACDMVSFNWGSYYGTINNTLNTVNLVVPHFTDLTTLVPTCAASIGATISPASGVQQDFSDSVANPLQYTVTAEDGVTQKTYAVTVTNNPEILWNPSFAGNANYWTLAGPGVLYEGQYSPGSHDAIGRSIRMMDPGGTLRQTVTLATGNYRLGGWFTGGTLTFQLRDSSNNPVTPAGAVSPAPTGAPQDPAPGDWVNWTRDYGNLPAGDYTVYVQCNTGWVHADDFSLVAIGPLPYCDLLAFDFDTAIGVITPGSPNTVLLTVPAGTNLAALNPTVTVSPLATYAPTGPQDFSNSETTPVPYTVTAEDGTTQQVYQVTVTAEAPAGYGAWALANGASANPLEDSNHNGVPNSIEYFMGGTQASPATLPPLVNTAGTWKWTIPYDPAALATYMFQVSGDLSGWTDVLPGDPAIEVLTGPDQLRLTLPTGMQFCRLVVTTP